MNTGHGLREALEYFDVHLGLSEVLAQHHALVVYTVGPLLERVDVLDFPATCLQSQAAIYQSAVDHRLRTNQSVQ